MNILRGVKIEMLDLEAKIPMRSTKGSAGYDIFAQHDILLPKNRPVTVQLPFTIRGAIEQDIAARIFVRSSFGIKKKVRLMLNGEKNPLGIVLNLHDTYHYVTLLNDSDEDLVISEGEHFAQVVFTLRTPEKEAFTIEYVCQEELLKHKILRSSVCEVSPNVFDYHTEEEFILQPNEQKTFATGLKAKIDEGTWLSITPHYSMEDKIMLANGTVVGDKDYYSNPSNDGNYHLAIVNLTDETIVLRKGTPLATWWSEKYFTVENEIKSTQERTGGIGSTSN